MIDLIQHGLDSGLKPDQAVDDAREKLHNIIAPYLGDPDYARLPKELPNIGTFPDADARMKLLPEDAGKPCLHPRTHSRFG